MNKIMIVLMFLVLISIVFVSGCIDLDPCRSSCDSAFERCNYNCGSGWLAGACKASCTSQHNNCLQNC